MAITAESRSDIIELVVAALKHAPGTALLTELVAVYEDAGNLSAVAELIVSSNEFTSLYPTFQTNEEFANEFLAELVPNADTAAVEEGVDIIVGVLNGGGTRADVIMEAAAFLSAVSEDDPAFGSSAALFNNWVEVAEYHTLEAELVDPWPIPEFVTSDDDTVSQATDLIDDVAAGPAPEPLSLTVGLDNISGTDGDDVISANVVANAEGFQTNQLSTGDRVNGGDGEDSLEAVVQAGSALGGGPFSAIAPITMDVEKAIFTGLGTGENSTTAINAKSMWGLDTVGSVASDSDVVIYNLTTLTDTGEYGDRRVTGDMTICWELSDNGGSASVDNGSDMEVYFDNDYLLCETSQTDSAFYWLLDRQGSRDVPERPLNNINVDGIRFELDFGEVDEEGNPITVEKFIRINNEAFLEFITNEELEDDNPGLVTGTAPDAGTFQGFVDRVADALADAADPDSPNFDAEIAAADLSFELSTDAAQTRFEGLDGTTFLVPAPAMILTSENDEVGVSPTGFPDYKDATGAYDVFGDFDDQPPSVEDCLVEVDVKLLKIGRGDDGGELVIGAMGNDGQNNWDYSSTALEEGVNQFNVLVQGDETQPSSLSGMRSTNNTLMEVYVDWEQGSLADLIIGNSNTGGSVPNSAPLPGGEGGFGSFLSFDSVTNSKNNALKDVRIFSAANNNSSETVPDPITTDVTLWAHLSDQVVDKYMDTTDDGEDPSMDNAEFMYSFGAGNDIHNINISQTNLSESGANAREDFSYDANMGAGNDTFVAQIGNGQGVAGTPWFDNAVINKNLSVDGGTGDDYIHVNGAGVWDIEGGSGDDAIYSDNSSRQVYNELGGGNGLDSAKNATWVFNSADQTQDADSGTYSQPLDDLTSAGPVTLRDDDGDVIRVANAELTVTFAGYSVDVTIPGTNGPTGNVVTDLLINNAIKSAINNDTYLSNVLKAYDGTGRTLIVESMIDGVYSDSSLSVSIGSSGSPSDAQDDAGAVEIDDSAIDNLEALGFESDGSASTGGSGVGRFDAAIADVDGTAFGSAVNAQLTGTTGPVHVKNTIDAGSGEDTVVLSSSSFEGLGGPNPGEMVDIDDDEADVVFNATNATIDYDSMDSIHTTGGATIAGGSGTVTVSTSAGDVTIEASEGSDSITLPEDNGVIETIVNTDIANNGFDSISGFTTAEDILQFSADDLNGIIGGGATDFADGVALVDGTNFVTDLGAGAGQATFFYYTDDEQLWFDPDGDSFVDGDGDYDQGADDSDIPIYTIATSPSDSLAATDIAIIA